MKLKETNCIFLTRGLSFHINGYTDIVDKIFTEAVKTAFTAKIANKHYLSALELVKSQIKQVREPYEKAIKQAKKALKPYYVSFTDLQLELPNANFSEFKSYVADLRSTAAMEVLAYGAFKPENLNQIHKTTEKYVSRKGNINLEETVKKLNSVRKIEGIVELRTKNKSPTETNGVIAIYYHVGPNSVENKVLLGLLSKAIGNIFFYELRSVQQLGYIVETSKTEWGNQLVLV